MVVTTGTTGATVEGVFGTVVLTVFAAGAMVGCAACPPLFVGAFTTISNAGATVVVVVVVVVGTAVTLMVTVPVVAELYVESEAFDAETVHEPTDDVDNTAPDNEQLADPADTSEYVTAPVPEPPEVASVRLVPNIVAVAAKVSVACVSFETVMVTVPVEIEL